MERLFSTVEGLILNCFISWWNSLSIAIFTFWASFSETPIQMECSEEACVIKTILTFTWAIAPKNLFEAPKNPTKPEPSNVINAILSILLIPLIGFIFKVTSRAIKVPSS